MFIVPPTALSVLEFRNFLLTFVFLLRIFTFTVITFFYLLIYLFIHPGPEIFLDSFSTQGSNSHRSDTAMPFSIYTM